MYCHVHTDLQKPDEEVYSNAKLKRKSRKEKLLVFHMKPFFNQTIVCNHLLESPRQDLIRDDSKEWSHIELIRKRKEHLLRAVFVQI